MSGENIYFEYFQLFRKSIMINILYCLSYAGDHYRTLWDISVPVIFFAFINILVIEDLPLHLVLLSYIEDSAPGSKVFDSV